jgi:hypothetical protein
MKKSALIFLQAVLVLVGLGIFAGLLWQPQVEGVNANATQFEIYFQDPFLAYVYLGSIPFFVALYQAFQILNAIGRNELFSSQSVRKLQVIRYCALITAIAIVAADTYLVLNVHEGDDYTGPVMLGMISTFISLVAATAAAVLERALQNAIDIKSENDLTV